MAYVLRDVSCVLCVRVTCRVLFRHGGGRGRREWVHGAHAGGVRGARVRRKVATTGGGRARRRQRRRPHAPLAGR
eukprot:552707-Prorocentrum_minimum.AAC.4